MMKADWIYHKYILYTYRYLYKKIKKVNIQPKRYAGKEMLTQQEGNNTILSLLKSNKPCMIGRFGSNELRVCSDSIAVEYKLLKEIRKSSIDLLTNCAGFFPNDKSLALQFGSLMKASSNQLDLIGVWFNSMEDFVIKKYAKHSKVTYLRSLEPWYNNNPWTQALEGKKVLVIHPFEETIIKQYSKRKYLFNNKNILPDFNLLTLKAIQTLAGERDKRFKTWFDALNFMYNEAMKKDFDIAIIGCGAYGFPLAAKIKLAGKQAIHLGGATQLLFGIKGKRWDSHPYVSKLYNEYWIRPLEKETPKRASIVEGACYW